MLGELVLVLPEEFSWENIPKFFGKDFFLLDDSSEQSADLSPEQNGLDSASRLYVKRRGGILISGVSRVKVVYDEGRMVIGGQGIAVRELVLTRMSGSLGECLRQAARLSKRYKCVLESRTHRQRAKDTMDGVMFGRFHIEEFSGRTLEDALHELIWWHLCGISQASAEFFLHSGERLPVRRLRVEIRKLRAVLAMLKGALNPDAVRWQEKLRTYTVRLSRLRELDIAAGNWRGSALNRKNRSKQGDLLSAFLTRERAEELAKIKPSFELTKFTPFLISFMEWIAKDPIREGYEEALLDKLAQKKLLRWHRFMQKTVKQYPDFSSDKDAHTVRVKAKSARYVMQSMSGKAYGDDNKVLRNLKRLLDALGIMRDNYVNEVLARSMLKRENDPELIYQAGIFAGGEHAQSLRVKKILPDLWEKFAADWERWLAR